MTFRQTLDEHLRAVRERDLPALASTLSSDDGDLVLVMSDGRVVRSVREFLALHRDWFASTTWRIAAEPLAVEESPELGFATFRLEYRDQPPGGKSLHELSVLTLAFARRQGRWVMVFDQNTPMRNPSRAEGD
jgi:ketosteroid isomerase-like protein